MFIQIKQLNKTFGSPEGILTVLKDVSFNVFESTILAVLGPSGCGKTTLLRLMAGLEKPDFGEVTIEGELESRPNTEMVFQHASLLPWRTALENVLLPTELNNRSDSSRLTDAFHKRAVELLGRMGLSSFAKYYPNELSSGMKARVALARALVTHPQILLLDEAFGALDEITRSALQDILVEIASDLHLTVIFVTHSIEESVVVADRILVLSNRPATMVADVSVDLPRGPSQRRDSDVTMGLRAKLRNVLNENASSLNEQT